MVYWTIIWKLWLFLKLFTRAQVQGAEFLPRGRPFLLVSNHISHFDPLVLSVYSPTRLDWMGSIVLLTNRFMRWFFWAVHIIPVRQYEADQTALREAVRRARRGCAIGIFPEGGLRTGEASLLGGKATLYEGAFMIAALARVPIVPALILGTDRLYNPKSLFERPKIWVHYGKPIEVKGKGREEAARLRDECVTAIQKMAAELRETGALREEDWPQTPQQRNPRIPPPGVIRF